MKTIWKYVLKKREIQSVFMPKGAEILSAQAQHQTTCIWVLVDTAAEPTERKIAIYGTGNPCPDDPGEFIDTVQFFDGELVFHIFEIPRRGKEGEDNG